MMGILYHVLLIGELKTWFLVLDYFGKTIVVVEVALHASDNKLEGFTVFSVEVWILDFRFSPCVSM